MADDFYTGRSVRLVVGTSAGGGTDITARLLSRHLGRFIPGNPNFVIVNQPGGGGLVLANRIANSAPRDGSEIATMERAIPQLAYMGDPQVRFDPMKLTWLGSLSSYKNDAFMLLVNSDFPASSVDELKSVGKPVRVGASRQGSTNLSFALVAKRVMGLPVEAIAGYAGTAKIALAMQSKEVDGQFIGLVSIQATQQDMWQRKLVKPLLQLGRRDRHPDLPNVPTGRELIKDPNGLALLEFAELPFFMAQSYVAPPDIPAARASILRKAFMDVTGDAEYIAEAKKLHIDNSPIDHREIEALLMRARNTPKPVIDAYAKIIAAND
ncbi:MAG: Bug family tripartite tricarboxylate transporter substrate binding protein [Beijerinckiaceae bacterium]